MMVATEAADTGVEIGKVAVIGAGVMGAGIAAQIANAGVPVLLLDLPAPGNARDAIAAGAIERMLKADPAPFMTRAAPRLVTPGNIEDDLIRLADCDWIIEAVAENADVKRQLYRRLEAVRKPGSVVSSNTSTIPLSQLVDGLSSEFAEQFCITHFFNPPRYMRLLELVKGEGTQPQALARVRRFADVKLGKSVVDCQDTPGFIANRLGAFWLQCAVVEAIDRGIEVEEADAIIGPPLGIPKTGVFGLLDLVGLDLVLHVATSLSRLLPPGDPFHLLQRDLPLIRRMIADGYTGRKGKGGFYRLIRDQGGGGRNRKEALSLPSGVYRPLLRVDPAIQSIAKGDLRALLSNDHRLCRYAWSVLSRTLSYAAALIPEAADGPSTVDEAVRLGYNWTWGPFELIDRLGAGWLADRLAAESRPVPPLLQSAVERRFYRMEGGRRQFLGCDGVYRDIERPAGVFRLSDVKPVTQPILKNRSAALWDIGDGVACFEFTTKMNALDPDVIELLGKTLKVVGDGFKALVVYNEGENFSVGANLGLALFAANIAAWADIEQMVAAGQEAYRALKYAPFPVVGAPSGMALGGGCELLLHCDAIQAHAETYMGLVECGVGLVPAWGGCKEMLHRWSSWGRLPKGPMPAVAKVFEILARATVAKSAAEAKELLFLRPTDGITMNRNRLLSDAKDKAIELALHYSPPGPPQFFLPGPAGRVALAIAAQDLHRRGQATAHDLVVAGALAEVLSGDEADLGRPVGEEGLLGIERRCFMRLIRQPATMARIESVLETGKPLRN